MAILKLKTAGKESQALPRQSEPSRLQEVLDVAVRHFKDVGYRSATLAAIGAELGMNKASLYYYVKSKEDLARKLILRASQRLRDRARDPILDALPPEEALRRLVVEHANALLDHPNEFALLIHQRRFISPETLSEITEREKVYIACVRSLIARGIGCKAFRPMDVGVATQLVLDSINSLLRWYRPGGRLSREDAIKELWKFVEFGVGATQQSKKGRTPR